MTTSLNTKFNEAFADDRIPTAEVLELRKKIEREELERLEKLQT